ncbi:MAG: GHKL domain-containing protein [bacterium]|nr:GHKL domain-containing protein [bacterium]
MFENTFINICGFVIINFFIIYHGYNIKARGAAIKVIICTALMMFSELLAGLLIHTELNNDFATAISIVESIIFAFVSKLLYITSMIIFKHISGRKEQNYKAKEMIYLIILPISTCLFLTLFNKISGSLDVKLEVLFIVFSVLLIISNFIAYIVCERIIDNNIQIHKLKQLEYKKSINERSYQLIQEKYAELKILVHDFEKYCNYIDGKIAGGQEDVHAITKKLRDKNKEFLIVEYTDNKALNILLSQKIKECNSKNIDFQICAPNTDLSFIEESDVIAIFGNLIDNAVESCMISKEKKIFLQIHTMNDKFLVINLENSSDNAPTVKNGRLKTFKHDKNKHGIGLMSVEQALNNYNGHLQWEYKAEKHIFVTTILIILKGID